MQRGQFITFEGPEGSGKSTQAGLLAERLRAEGCRVLQVREPGGTGVGETIRGMLQSRTLQEPLGPETETLLFLACRAHLAGTVIAPALAAGRWVLADRFMDSTLAYQGYGRGMERPLIRAMNRFAVGACMPDLTLLLDVPVALGFERLRARCRDNGSTEDRIESAGRAFHEKVRRGYLAMARRDKRFRVIDASGPVETTATAVWNEVARVLER